MNPNPVIHTSNLTIGYHTKSGALNPVHSDLITELFKGEITCLLGPNGCGKSTLIRTLAGFQKPLSGNVFIDEIPVQNYAVGDLAEKIGVVLTGQVFVGHMTVYDMVAFGRSPYTGFLGRLGKNDHDVIRKAIDDTGISNLSNRKFTELSDGERQKVMIAKSLAQETPVILLDEPTAFLDFPSKVEILQLLRDAAWKHQKAVLLSTHDLNLAISFADKIWLMAGDKPMETGIPEDLILAGQIGRFFDRPKTRFDMQSGNFEFSSNKARKVFVDGSGLKYQWLVKAMIRKGYEVNDDKENPVKISAEDEVFYLSHQNHKTKFDTIDELLVELENLKKQNPGR